MHNLKWSDSEKKIARRAFDTALAREYSALLLRLKAQAAAAEVPTDIWDLRDLLIEQGKAFDRKYDYRYSQLIFVFAQLLQEKWLEKHELEGLKDDKLEMIARLLSL